MFLIDTNVLSELRKKKKANVGVRRFFDTVDIDQTPLYISVITVGELQRGISLLTHRQDFKQALQLTHWLDTILSEYYDFLLEINADITRVWGRLRVPHPENALDKLIAASALVYGLTVVTRNEKDFVGTGVPTLNPWST